MRRLRDLAPPTRRQVRIAVGVLWLLDAALQAQPDLFTADWWRGDLAQSVMGQPSAINHSIFSVVNLIAAHPAIWNSAFVASQACLGVALILGRFERTAIVASIPWALGIWWVGEGFGTIPTGFALAATGSPGPVLCYPLIALLAWPTRPTLVPGSGHDTDPLAPIRQAAGTVAWVSLWAGQALLQIPWVFPARQVLVANITEYSQDQPPWLRSIAHISATLARDHPAALTLALALSQVLVGLGVLNPRTRRTALGAGVAISVAWWFAFQYLGGLARGDATDPGAAPLMILLAVSLWPPPDLGTAPRQTTRLAPTRRSLTPAPTPRRSIAT